MLTNKEKSKKENKGFTLVELIVVIVILAIIAINDIRKKKQQKMKKGTQNRLKLVLFYNIDEMSIDQYYKILDTINTRYTVPKEIIPGKKEFD